MEILVHDLGECQRLQASFEELGLTYGHGRSYTCLIAPASVLITAAEAADLEADIRALAELYSVSTDLYRASSNGEAPPWISSFAEQGLSPIQRSAHRIVAQEGLEPIMARVDYVDLSRDDGRQVAEVQWKSGGPGYFYGHDPAFKLTFPLSDACHAFGDLTGEYVDLLGRACQDRSRLVVNEVRGEWLNGEAHLRQCAQSKGLSYCAIDRSKLADSLRLRQPGVIVDACFQDRFLGALRGRGFTDVLSDETIYELAKATVKGELWIETPINFLYRQKWALALPFMDQFRNTFDPRLREIVIPTALVIDERIDLEAVARSVGGEHGDRISTIRVLDDLPKLPSSIRQRLVLKCGSGVGELHSRGRGVYRLGGPREKVGHIVRVASERIHTLNEPWIIQPFVSRKYRVPLALPNSVDPPRFEDVHSRLMVFCGRNGPRWSVHGAIGNFRKHWKVSGASARQDTGGDLLGAAFTDVRLSPKVNRSPLGD